MQKITPCLWFDKQVEEAICFYTSIFPDSEILNISRYPDGTPDLAGKVLTATFRHSPFNKLTPDFGFPLF